MDSVIVLLIVVLVYKSQVSSFKFQVSSFKLPISFISVFVLFGAFVGFEYVFKSLIFNSNIVFNFTNILNLSAYSIIGLIVISILIFTYYILNLLFVGRILIKLSVQEFIICSLVYLFIGSLVYFILINWIHFSLSHFYLNLIVPLAIISIVWYFTKISSIEYRSIKYQIGYLISE